MGKRGSGGGAGAGKEKLFQVQSILKKRQVKKRVEYLVKWEGYSEKHNSWEPAANFLNSDLIAQFEASEKERRLSGSAAPSTPVTPATSAEAPPASSSSGRCRRRDEAREPEIRRSARTSGQRLSYAAVDQDLDMEIEEALARPPQPPSPKPSEAPTSASPTPPPAKQAKEARAAAEEPKGKGKEPKAKPTAKVEPSAKGRDEPQEEDSDAVFRSTKVDELLRSASSVKLETGEEASDAKPRDEDAEKPKEEAVTMEAEEELENCVPALLAAVSAANESASEEDIPAPPSLQPEVSESEAWMISERKKLAEESGEEKAKEWQLVVTDVAVKGASVVFKESKTGPSGFFHNYQHLYREKPAKKAPGAKAAKAAALAPKPPPPDDEQPHAVAQAKPPGLVIG